MGKRRGHSWLWTGSLLSVLGLASSAWASGWEKIDEEGGIAVFSKDVPNSPLIAFRGETVIAAPLEKILWVLADNDHRTEWVDRLEKSVVLDRKGDYEYVVYQHFGLPFPISDREYVYRGRAVAKNGTVVLAMESVTHSKAPTESEGVRARLIQSQYVLTPLDPERTRVVVEIHTDPKGLIPGWLVNLIQESWPMKTLAALTQQVKKPYVGRLAAPP